MYEQFYGFTRKPFSISPDPAFFFQNTRYSEAFALLQYGMKERRGIFCLFGEVGTGKTMLLQRLIQTLDDSVIAVTLPYPKLSFEDVLDHLLTELRVEVDSPKVTVRLSQLHARLVSENTLGRTIALLVDEAQGMDTESLENLRLLSNLETSSEKLLQIILLGQPELRDKLNLDSLRQFKQRVAISFELKPLLPEETPQYIAHRLRVSGYGQGLRLFSDRAIFLITNYSRGIPRLINALCDNALLIGCVLKQREIDEKVIREAAADLMLDIKRAQPTQPVLRPPAAETRTPPLDQPSIPSAHPVFPDPVPEMPAMRSLTRTTRQRNISFRMAALSIFIIAFLTIFSVKVQSSKEIRSILDRAFLFGKEFVEGSGATNRPSPPYSASTQRDPEMKAIPVVSSPSSTPSAKKSTPAGTVPASQAAAEQVEAPSISVPPPQQNAVGETPPPDNEMKGESRLLAPREIEPEGQAVQTKETEKIPISPVNEPQQDTAPPGGSAEIPRNALAPGPQVALTEVGPTRTESKPPAAQFRLAAVADAVKTVRKGETLSGIAKEVYGSANLRTLSFIQMTNPWIQNIDFILEGQSLALPPMNPEHMIFDQADGLYAIYITATRDLSVAQNCQNQLNLLRMTDLSVSVVPVWLTGSNRIYRLQAGGFRSKDVAMAALKVILPLKYIESIREEIQ